MKLGFYGAVGTFTGSKFVVESGGTRAGIPSALESRRPLVKKDQAERDVRTLTLSWGRESTTIDLSEVQEIYVLQLGDSFMGLNKQIVLLVTPTFFVGMRGELVGHLWERFEELRAKSRVYHVGLMTLPWRWAWGVFGGANMKPIRRPIAELERVKKKDEWDTVVPDPEEDLFPE